MVVIGCALIALVVGMYSGYVWGYERRRAEDNEYWGTNR